MVVDGELQRRTAVKKKTSSPQWDEVFTLSVNESSVLEFRVVNKAKVFDDSLLGSKTVKLSHWIKKESSNGKCEVLAWCA